MPGPLVMKFGGTSVQDADALARLTGIVTEALGASRASGQQGPVVVVSALSKVTDTLMKVADRAAEGATDEVHGYVSGLRERHLAIASMLRDPEARAAVGEPSERLEQVAVPLPAAQGGDDADDPRILRELQRGARRAARWNTGMARKLSARSSARSSRGEDR